ncbi:MAG: Tagatose-6-phosphate kinase [Firmicutes bacterium ADurb.Bin193]|nr:MAG: Tagatose-6-phosphate kinase [Firmicutes bacterium ADurb.Bin193]
MILTVTINPSVDKTYILKRFEKNVVNRARRVMHNAGSKGINVSRVVRLLGQDTCALGFVGGTTGDILISKLNEEGINHEFIHAKNFSTRLNVKVMDLSEGSVTELNESGDPVSDEDFDLFMEKYKEKLPTADIVVISGSILPKMPIRVYYDLAVIAGKYNKPVFLDCGGAVLRESLKALPYCIKPNLKEFEEMLGESGLSEDRIVDEAKKIIEKHSIPYVVVTLGVRGAIGVSKDAAYKVIPPDVTVGSTVGAGDAFLAGMCHAYLKKMDFPRQLIVGASCASAKITKEGNDVPSLIELLGYADGCRVVQL